jgi:hypothetical protein
VAGRPPQDFQTEAPTPGAMVERQSLGSGGSWNGRAMSVSRDELTQFRPLIAYGLTFFPCPSVKPCTALLCRSPEPYRQEVVRVPPAKHSA